MSYEVVVVGGGIGGLTTAALLAARGMSVCLLERQSRLGGCLAPFEKFAYTFENSFGFYPLFGAGGIHERIFAELRVSLPELTKLEAPYSVRMADGLEVQPVSHLDVYLHAVRSGFPECADRAENFLREAQRIGEMLLQAWDRNTETGRPLQFGSELDRLMPIATVQHLEGTSSRFQRYIDAQLRAFGQAGISEASYLYTCLLLAMTARGCHSIRSGATALIQALSNAFKSKGGRIRLNAPALRLAFDASGSVEGVILLTGETVSATRAVVSNLTVWDTFGKLVGLDRTPGDIRKRIKTAISAGVYEVYLGLDAEVAKNLSSERIILAKDNVDDGSSDLLFSLAPDGVPAPEGKRAATVILHVDVNDWFTYHVDETEHDEQDQATLESVWEQLHQSMPELGASAEVIESVTPRTWYDDTRRKLGMMGGLPQTTEWFATAGFPQDTPLNGLFMVGDTVFPGPGIAAVSWGAWQLANRLTRA